MPEDWKGEGLIREVAPTKLKRGPPRKKPTPKNVCAVPDCENELCASNSSKVCRSHNHVAPNCECRQCWRPK